MSVRETGWRCDELWLLCEVFTLGEHQIYREDAVLDYPESGERVRGLPNTQSSRAGQQTGSASRCDGSRAQATSGSLSMPWPITGGRPTQ